MSAKDDQDLKIRDYIERKLAEAPPLSGMQRARLYELLAPMRGQGSGYIPLPPPPLSERELRRAELTEQAKSIAAEVQACAICGVPIFVHDRWGHPWEPLEAAIVRYGRDGGTA